AISIVAIIIIVIWFIYLYVKNYLKIAIKYSWYNKDVLCYHLDSSSSCSFVLLANSSIEIGFLVKQLSLWLGNAFLNSSAYDSNADIKQTFILLSILLMCRYSSNPFIFGILTSRSNRS